MRHVRFGVAGLLVDGIELPLKAGYLLAAASDDGEHPQWECLAYGVDVSPIERGAYQLELATVDGRKLHGDAVVVRSVDGAHVFRGAGRLHGVDPAELA